MLNIPHPASRIPRLKYEVLYSIIRNLIFGLVCLWFTSTPLFSQSSLVVTTFSSYSPTSTSVQEVISNSQADSSVTHISYGIFSLTNMPVSDIVLTIPGQDTIEVALHSIDFPNGMTYAWYGRTIDQNGYLGFGVSNGVIYGVAQSDSAVYDFFSLVGDTIIIRKRTDVFNEVCGITNEFELMENLDLCNEAEDCETIIDIGILVSPDALDWVETTFGNQTFFPPSLYIGLCYHIINWSLVNSEVQGLRCRFHLDFSSFDPTYYPNSFDEDLYKWSYDFNSYRTTNALDLVVFTVGFDYPNIGGIAKGYYSWPYIDWSAQFPDISPLNEWDLPCYSCYAAIAEVPRLSSPFFTGIHEIGHLLALRHLNDDDGDCEHGFDLEVNEDWKTIMSTTSDRDRLLHFSNPDVDVFNEPSGDEDWSNAAMMLRQSQCIVGDYLPQHFSAMVIGEKVVCYDEVGESVVSTADLEIIVHPGTPPLPGVAPFTYEWRWNTTPQFNGGNPGYYINNTPYVSLGAYNQPVFYVLARVISDDQLQWKQIFAIEVLTDDCGNPQHRIQPFHANGFEIKDSLAEKLENKGSYEGATFKLSRLITSLGLETGLQSELPFQSTNELQYVLESNLYLPPGMYFAVVQDTKSSTTFVIKIIKP